MTTTSVPRLSILVGWVVIGGPVAAQQPDSLRADSVSSLQEIVVQARRPVATVGGAAAVVLRPDSLNLPPAPTLEMVLREMPAFHVRRNSRGEAELSARGSGSRQVAVLVDGIPLNHAWDARADVSVIPATAPQRVELTRGLSSMLSGPNVLGGVVEVSVGRSLLQPSAPSVHLTTGFDHVGGFGSGATMTLPLETEAGRWLIRAGAAFRDTPGDPLARGIVEPLPQGDLRVNTDARHVDGFASVRFHDNHGAWLSLSGSSFAAERGIAAELGVGNPRFWRYPSVARTVVVATLGTGHREALFGGTGDLEASVGVDLGRTHIDSYTSRDYSQTNGFERGRDRTLTFRLLGDHALGARGELKGSFMASEIRHDESLPDAEGRYRQRLMSLGGETAWRLTDETSALGALRVTLGGAWDIGTTPETAGRPALGTLTDWGMRAGFTLALRDEVTLVHGGVSRRSRFPALRELYSGALDRFAPNPALRPERLVALEAGATRRLGRGELQAVAFLHRLSDAVERAVLPDGRFMRVNRDRLASHGVELIGSAPLGPVTLSGDVTVQSVRLEDPVAGARARPENTPEVMGSVRARLPIALGVFGGAGLQYTGSQSCLDPGSGAEIGLDGGTLLHAEATRAWPLRRGSTGIFSRVETTVSVDNLGNAALHDQCGLPRPGRLLRVELRVF